MNGDVASRARSLARLELRRLIPELELRYAAYCVIGGWAVFAYNPYQGSIDVDLIYQHGVNADGIVLGLGWLATESQETQERILRYVKQFDGGQLYLDLLSSENPNLFHENTSKSLPFSLALENRNSASREIEGMQVTVPRKELLLAYKIKAYRDRRKRLENDKLSKEELPYLQGKITKDATDLLALIDPTYEPINRELFHQLLAANQIGFTLATLKELPDLEAAILAGYRDTPVSKVKSWVELLV